MVLIACTGGAGGPPAGCTGSCASGANFLSVADVERVIAQAVAEAGSLNAEATVAVVDRVGNVLAVYRMSGASPHEVVIGTAFDGGGQAIVQGGLEGIRLPALAAAVKVDDQAAIAKAITAAYLSSEGNAFSTRTASQIIQQHFNVGELQQPAGPLFGVQFSQLACSDAMLASTGAPGVGPQRSPLGLAADPGGFPLYKDGTVVGGVGVMADGVYGLDVDITDIDGNLDEQIAWAATFGFSAPLDRRADRITVGGRSLRYSDLDFDDLGSDPALAPAFGTLPPGLVATIGYVAGGPFAGTAFGQAASGIRADSEGNYPGADAFVLVDAGNLPRYPPQAATDALPAGASLTGSEVLQLMRSALDVASRSRGQIRQPAGSSARVTIAVVDTLGTVLALASSRDAPVFGLDVSVQKARSAALLSSDTAASFLAALPAAKYLSTSGVAPAFASPGAQGDYVTALRSFMAAPTALADGQIAFSARAIGNLARPTYPDGIDGSAAGPLSKPAGQWSVLSTGQQLDVAVNAMLQHVLHVAGTAMPDVGPGCAGVDLTSATTATPPLVPPRLANGLQIFPGAVPIYRGATLVGAIGVSGDGVDQDDMIAFLGVHDAGVALGGVIGNAPLALRADAYSPMGVRLRYVQCPQAPFLDGSGDQACEGK